MLINQTNVNSALQYFLQDAQNSTIAIADDTGAVTSEYNYDAFDNLDDTIDPLSAETSYLYLLEANSLDTASRLRLTENGGVEIP